MSISPLLCHCYQRAQRTYFLPLTARLLGNVLCHVACTSDAGIIFLLMWRNSDPLQSSQPFCRTTESPFDAPSPGFSHPSDQSHSSSDVLHLHQACRAVGFVGALMGHFLLKSVWLIWDINKKERFFSFFFFELCFVLEIIQESCAEQHRNSEWVWQQSDIFSAWEKTWKQNVPVQCQQTLHYL